MFENIQHHLEASLICKQTMHEKVTAAKVNEVVKPMKSKELNAKKMNKSKMMKQKCRGCLKEFSNLNQHIGKSFPCQNNYVDEDYDQTFTKDWESYDNESAKRHKENNEKKNKTGSIRMENNLDTGIVIEDEDVICEDLKSFDLATLELQNWLNDEVINSYLKLLNTLDNNVFMLSTYFHTSFREGGFRRVKNYYKNMIY